MYHTKHRLHWKFSVGSAKFHANTLLGKAGKRGEEESPVIKFWFLKTAYKSENMSGPGSMSNSHLRGANKQPSYRFTKGPAQQGERHMEDSMFRPRGLHRTRHHRIEGRDPSAGHTAGAGRSPVLERARWLTHKAGLERSQDEEASLL